MTRFGNINLYRRMATIFHYTDLHGFKAIVENKTLWLSLAHHMNDEQEISWARSKFYNAIKRKTTSRSQKIFEYFSIHENANRGTPYICSFSKDGDMLSQWRAYSNDGSGVAIGFDTDYFDFKQNIPRMSTSKDSTIALLDVVYNETFQDIYR